MTQIVEGWKDESLKVRTFEFMAPDGYVRLITGDTLVLSAEGNWVVLELGGTPVAMLNREHVSYIREVKGSDEGT